MIDEHDTDREEQRLRAVLRGLDADAPAPDRSVLDSLREQTLKLFDEAIATNPAATHPAEPPKSPALLTPSTALKKPRNPMITLAIRGLVAVAGLAAALVVGLNVSNRNHSIAATPFSEVLKNLRGQQTLELQVTKEGKSAEVWVRAPGSVRWQDSPERYRIAVGSRLWKIDSAANTVTTGDSPWFIDPKRQVDLLGLLEIGVRESDPLLRAKPVDKAEYDGHDCYVYRVDLRATDGPVQVSAYADAATKQFVGIVARDRLPDRPVARRWPRCGWVRNGMLRSTKASSSWRNR